MSLLLTAVAVRHDSADDVADVVLAVLRDAGRRVEALPPVAQRWEPTDCDIIVGAEAGGWVSVHPHYLVPADGLAMALTSRLGTVSSSTSIYEDVFWTHDLVSHGRILDRFVNLPGYFESDEYGREHEGNPHLVADTLGVDPAWIAPYFRQISLRRARSRLLPPPKAHPSDTFDLLNGWVITDLWGRLGIAWGLDHPVARIPLGDEANTALSRHLWALASS